MMGGFMSGGYGSSALVNYAQQAKDDLNSKKKSGKKKTVKSKKTKKTSKRKPKEKVFSFATPFG